MSQTAPNPIEGSNNPFRSDDEAREESRQGDAAPAGVGIPLLDLDPDAENTDRDEPGDRV